MNGQRVIIVTPIYGWGWTISGQRSGDVPEPFGIVPELSGPPIWQGKVLDKGHMFEGMTAQLSKRHDGDFDGCVNIDLGVAPDSPASSSGYAIIAVPEG